MYYLKVMKKDLKHQCRTFVSKYIIKGSSSMFPLFILLSDVNVKFVDFFENILKFHLINFSYIKSLLNGNAEKFSITLFHETPFFGGA